MDYPLAWLSERSGHRRASLVRLDGAEAITVSDSIRLLAGVFGALVGRG